MGLRDKYEIHSNKESGLGRCDLIFRPFNKTQKSIILEFKVCRTPDDLEKTSHTALAQIEEKQYVTSQDTLKIGLAFCEKEVVSVYYDPQHQMVFTNRSET